MEHQIAQLMERYGGNHNYQALTDRQRSLLLNTAIRENTDGCRWKTVQVRNITSEVEGTLLDILDVYVYVFHRNGPGGRGDYAIARIPEFKRALGVTEDPVKLEGPQVYLFQLPDNSKVKVQYDTVKDRV